MDNNIGSNQENDNKIKQNPQKNETIIPAITMGCHRRRVDGTAANAFGAHGRNGQRL